MVLSPYNDGSDPLLLGNDPFSGRALLGAGYAVLGVTMRGSGCSDGALRLFDEQMPHDGAAAVEWAARQPWSDGRVGMFGLSYPGIAQLSVAGQRPPHLRAIAPFQFASDLYRDAVFPGGLLNVDFAAVWAGAMQPELSVTTSAMAAARGEPDCALAGVEHTATYLPANLDLLGHDYDYGYLSARSPQRRLRRIEVPTLVCASWQDDMLGSRGVEALEDLDPSRTWFVGANGYHGICDDAWMRSRLVSFFDRYVRGIANGFDRAPHVVLEHELQTEGGKGIPPLNGWLPEGPLPTTGSVPRWTTTFDRWPVPVRAVALHLADSGRLQRSKQAGGDQVDSFVYPLPAASTVEGGWSGGPALAWKLPGAPGGGVQYTTPPLAADAEIFGPGSVDLWIRSSAPDTDLQVTLTEVRPDGAEVYLQRGWLRASHGRLDRDRSTALRPFHTHRAEDQRALRPGARTAVRIELLPLDHVIRAGSSLRLTIHAPTGLTGLAGFSATSTPGRTDIFHSEGFASRLVLGVVPGARSEGPLPRCDSLINQPCRANLSPVPAGSIELG
jgi:predicted acyl esterase